MKININRKTGQEASDGVVENIKENAGSNEGNQANKDKRADFKLVVILSFGVCGGIISNVFNTNGEEEHVK